MTSKLCSINLSDQMAICDANYIRILKLLKSNELNSRREIAFPPIGQVEQTAVIEIIEKFKYTSTIKLSQHLSSEAEQYTPPEMLIRMYHDASTAEVISYQSQRNIKVIYPLSRQEMSGEMHWGRPAPNEAQQLNKFLAEWLKVCLDEGLCLNKALLEEYESFLSEEI